MQLCFHQRTRSSPPLLYQEKSHQLTPLDIVWQKVNADCLTVTPKEEEERKKRMANINNWKDEMAKLREQVKKTDDEVKIILKELKDEVSSVSVEKYLIRLLKCII